MNACYSTLTITLALGSACFGHTWNVDDDGLQFSNPDFTSIQDAINAAADGDEIRVWQGTYTGTGYAVIDTKGKAIWIRGMGDPWDPAPVIDGEMQRRAIHCASGETASTIIQGFQVVNGSESHGAGLMCYAADPTIRYCGFRNNHAESTGGGALLQFSNAVFDRCTFANNTSVHAGGGLYMQSSSSILEDCTFSNNNADTGGAIHGVISDQTIMMNCTFNDHPGNVLSWRESKLHAVNTVFKSNSGVAVKNWDASISFENCEFTDNTGAILNKAEGQVVANNCSFRENISQRGGAIENIDVSSMDLVNCTFESNQSVYWGGGAIYSEHSHLSASNCSFITNSAPNPIMIEGGGAILLNQSTYDLSGCAFNSNQTGREGGAISIHATGFNADYSSMADCIFDTNDAIEGGGVWITGGRHQISACTFKDNNCPGGGGGLHANAHTLELNDSTFTGNIATNEGGGAYLCEGMVNNCRFEGNQSGFGGGTWTMDGNQVFTNCTWENNLGWSYGGGAYVLSGESTFQSCTFMSNTSNQGSAIYAEHGIGDQSQVNVLGSTVCGNHSASAQLGIDPGDLYLDASTLVSQECASGQPSPDLNGSGQVDGADMGLMLAAFGTSDSTADLDQSGMVDGADLGLLLAAWGSL